MTLLVSERLTLRPWRESDLEPFHQMNQDPEVMRYFPALLSRDQSDEMAQRIQLGISRNGWGFWALEENCSGEFTGFVGLNQPDYPLPFGPCMEVGWRLSPRFWGRGYATEGARRALKFAFTELQREEVVSFTSILNHRSRKVMQRLGMSNCGRNFNHPRVPVGNPLCEHLLYALKRTTWLHSVADRPD